MDLDRNGPSRRGKSLRFTWETAATTVQNQLWANIPQSTVSKRRYITTGIQSTTGVIPVTQHKAITKHARKTNHIERFNNTLRQRVFASSVTLWLSPKSWRTILVLSNTSYAITT